MVEKTAEECIGTILALIEARKHVDYGDKVSVRRYNAAYDKIYETAKFLNDQYPTQLTLLTELFSHPDICVVTTCAPLVFRLDHATKAQKRLAVEAIKRAIRDPRLDAASKRGFSASLPGWEKQI